MINSSRVWKEAAEAYFKTIYVIQPLKQHNVVRDTTHVHPPTLPQFLKNASLQKYRRLFLEELRKNKIRKYVSCCSSWLITYLTVNAHNKLVSNEVVYE